MSLSHVVADKTQESSRETGEKVVPVSLIQTSFPESISWILVRPPSRRELERSAFLVSGQASRVSQARSPQEQ